MLAKKTFLFYILGKRLSIALSFCTLTVGCAGNLGKEPLVQKPSLNLRVSAFDKFSIKIRSNSDIPTEEDDKNRISDRIRHKIDRQRSNLFANTDPSHVYEIDIFVTNYNKGNFLSRLVPTGLNKLVIDAKVSVIDLPTRSRLADFTVNKVYTPTVYSGSTSPQVELENAFAEEITNTIFR